MERFEVFLCKQRWELSVKNVYFSLNLVQSPVSVEKRFMRGLIREV